MAEQVASVEQLVSAREARGLSADDVVRQLKLAPRQVHAIESGDWEALPGGAFVKGALRGYGRLLGVDVQPLLDSLDGQVRTSDLRPASSLHEPMPRGGVLGFGSGGSGHRVAWVVLAIAGVTALALFFGRGGDLESVPSWLSRGNSPAPAPEATTQAPAGQATGEARPATGTTTETVPIAVPPVPAAEPSGGATTAAGGAAPGAYPVASAATSAAAAGSAPPSAGGAAATAATAPAGGTAPPSAAAAAGAAPAATSLQLRFARDAWVEVRAADGTVLLSGVQKADTRSAVPIAGPVSLVIGNADHVSVELGGRPVDLKPHVKGSVARLTLP